MKHFFIALSAGILGFAAVHPVSAADAAGSREKDLYSFCNQANCLDGGSPQTTLVDVNGTLYGTTAFGGGYSLGTVFAVNRKTGAETVVYSFCSQAIKHFCLDGSIPLGGLIAVKGKLYGTTTQGGDRGCFGNGCGTVFSVDPKTGAETVIHNFGGRRDGAYPYVGPIDVSGKLYGTTFDGGTGNCQGGCGTVFQVDPNTGNEKVLYSFCTQQNCADGADPYSRLIAVNGILYGTTFYGGNPGCAGLGCGSVFSIDLKSGGESVLYAFSGGADGAQPAAGLINVNGALYGTTEYAGGGGCSDRGCGTVFSVDPGTGKESVIHSFTHGSDGSNPEAELADVDGTLYGTTVIGGQAGCGDGCGTVFSIDPKTGAEKVVYAFSGTDRVFPSGSVTSVNGTLYGTTLYGGANDDGMVFALTNKQ